MPSLTAEQKRLWVDAVVLRALSKADIDTRITPTPSGMTLELTFTDTDAIADHIANVAAERERLRQAHATQVT